MIRYKKPVSGEYDAYFETYFRHVADDDRDVLTILRDQGLGVLEGLKRLSDEQADHRYAAGKWSARDLVGHIIDSERLFAFRALWFARGAVEPQPGMDEDAWAELSNAGTRSRKDLWKEHHVTRTNHLYLLRSFDETAIGRRGVANGAEMTVNAIPWIMAGHEKHHLLVLRERYGIDFLSPRPAVEGSPAENLEDEL